MILSIIILFVLICLLYYWITQDTNIDKNQIINTLYRQCARWSTASTQDTSPLIANLHANYAAGYLWALEDVFTTDEINRATGGNHRQFRSEIKKNQDITTKKLIQTCPQFAQLVTNTSSMIARIAGE
jgi:hypothetical protein